ncbi:MAG: LuxR C-terminal-related transcriptional regulator [Micrococcales bacterium]|nr:LuxR C-terminal-related transcriptional regulator [Micrococcales bacterium]
MQDLRPRDSDATMATLRHLRTTSTLPVVFAGACGDGTVTLNQFLGTRTRGMNGLRVRSGTGLGGKVMDTKRPTTLEDYSRSTAITKDYTHIVSQEGLRAMVAVPVIASGRARTVLYGAAHVSSGIGDQVKTSFLEAARTLSRELEVRDEVDRRVSMSEVARAEQVHGLEPADLARLREVHGELRAIAAAVDDPDLRARLMTAGAQIAGLGLSRRQAAAGPVLSPRELDVLAQVALGCSNAEAATRLGLSAETVKAYLRSVAHKLETSTRMESVTRARVLGLLP